MHPTKHAAGKIAALVGVWLSFPAQAQAPDADPIAFQMGSDKAPVTGVEYGSTTSHWTAKFHNEELLSFKRKYIDTGRVKFVFREFLSAPTKISARAFQAAHCAGADGYMKMLTAIFQDQSGLWREGENRSYFVDAAKRGGIPALRLQQCDLSDQALAPLIEADTRVANAAAISSAPTILVNGIKLEGLVEINAKLEATVDALLSRPG